MAPLNATTEAELRRLHPPPAHPLGPLPETEAQQLSFSEEDILLGVDRFRKGSAAGPSGLRPEHLIFVVRAAPNRRDRAIHFRVVYSISITKTVYQLSAVVS